MKPQSLACKIFSLSLFIFIVSCAAAKPTAPVQRTQTASGNTAPASTENSSDTASSSTTVDSADAAKTKENMPTVEPTPAAPAAPAAVFGISSSAFANMAAIPAQYVAKNGGGNQSPPLQWKSAPAGTGSFAIQMVDLDFQNPPFIHWIISNIPATSTQLPAAIPAGNNLAAPTEALGANQTSNYRGPNPPNLHRYEWTIYAIKQGMTVTLGANSATNKTELESKSLGKATLIGTYQ